ncbi:MAG: ribonuclease HII [Bacilli bacterium]|nr:ribonuclease HII [Bacilli bacterium]
MEEDLLKYEHELYKEGQLLVAGVDEVGRGPLFGPVVTAAVILPKDYKLEGLTDSKKLSPKKRDVFYEVIKRDAISISIGIRSAKEIDKLNIYQATKEAMMDAIENLEIKPDHVLIDAMKLENLKIPSTSIIKGDAKSLSIAAASVIAKVTRDRMMDEESLKYPEYGFEHHKGYPTKSHIEAVKKYGVLEGYRKTFEPIKSIINGSELNERSKKRRKAKTKTIKI